MTMSKSRRDKVRRHVLPTREEWLARWNKPGATRMLSAGTTDGNESVPVSEVVRWLNLLFASSEVLEQFTIDVDSKTITVGDLKSKMELVESALKQRAKKEEEQQARDNPMGFVGGNGEMTPVVGNLPSGMTMASLAAGRRQVPFKHCSQEEKSRRIKDVFGR